MGQSSRRSADLRAPERRLVGREIPVLRAEIALQFDGIASGERRHCLEPDGGGEQDMGGRTLAKGAPDFGRAVQHEPTAHSGRGTGIDLVEQRRAEEVCTVDGCCEEAGPRIKRALIIIPAQGSLTR